MEIFLNDLLVKWEKWARETSVTELVSVLENQKKYKEELLTNGIHSEENDKKIKITENFIKFIYDYIHTAILNLRNKK